MVVPSLKCDIFGVYLIGLHWDLSVFLNKLGGGGGGGIPNIGQNEIPSDMEIRIVGHWWKRAEMLEF